MENLKSVNTPVETVMTLSKKGQGAKVEPVYFKSLVRSLRYLIATRLDILYDVGLVTRYMESPRQIHLQNAKKILWYIKKTLDYGMFYTSSDNPSFVGYTDSNGPVMLMIEGALQAMHSF